VSCLVRPVPFTAWQEWEWALDLVSQELHRSWFFNAGGRTLRSVEPPEMEM
jgi:hypothetical protein